MIKQATQDGPSYVSHDRAYRLIEGQDLIQPGDSVTFSPFSITEISEDTLPDNCDMDQARDVLGWMVLAQDLTTDEMELILSVFDSWEIGVDYSIDDLVRYSGALYKVNIAHKSQSDWPPDSTPNLFSPAAPAGVIPIWVQPTGAQDSYHVGDFVQYPAGTIWECTAGDASGTNSWAPGVYGWTNVTA